MNPYKQTKLEKLMIELTQVGIQYRETEKECAKQHYDNYATILIENNVPEEQKQNYYATWRGLKKKLE